MIRIALAGVAVTVACGRVGFDPIGGDGATAPDAGVVTGGFGGMGGNAAFAVAAMADGGVAVAAWVGAATTIGGVEIPNAGGTDIVVLRIGPDSTLRWARAYGTPGSDLPLGIAVAPDETIYAVGVVHDSIDLGGGVLPMSGDDDGFVVSLTGDGAYRWSRLIGGNATGAMYGSDQVRGVAADADGVYVTGYVSNAVDFGDGVPVQPTGGSFDAFIAAFDPAGGERWVKRFGDTRYNAAHRAVATPGGGVVVAGYYEGTPDLGGGPASAYRGVQDTFVVAYDRDGGFRWQADFGGPGFDWPLGLDVDAAGNVYVSGFFETSVDLDGGITGAGGRDGFVTSYTAGGLPRWTRTFGGIACDGLRDVRIIDDTVVVAGGFGDTVDLGGPMPVTATGPSDMVVRTYTTTGTPSFATTIGGADADFLLALAGHDAQHTWLAGSSSGTGGDWCQNTSDTTSLGYITPFPLP